MAALIQSVVALAILLSASCLAAPLAQRLRLPHSVLLAGFGLAIGIAGIATDTMPFALATDGTGVSQAFGLSAQGLLLLFLPPLLFTAGLNVDVRLLMDEVWAVMLLAVVAVLVTTGVVGAALSGFGGLGWVAALLLGAIIATTDPAAVVAVFRDLGATKRLRVIVEGESLLNDAAAIALFAALSVMALPGGQGSAYSVAISALPSFAIGAVTGVVTARLSWVVFGLLGRRSVLEATFSLVLPYAAYVFADQVLGASGVVAVAFAGLAMAAEGPSRLPPENWEALKALWNWIEFVVVSIVFLVSSLLAAHLVLSLTLGDWALCVLVFVAALVARALVLYGLLPLLTWLGLAEPVDQRFKAIILWGGLRGAITLILALAVMENLALPYEFRATVAGIAVGYVYLTLFVSAPLLRPLLSRLGLDRLSRAEEAMRERVLAVSAAQRAKQLRATARRLNLSRELVATTEQALIDPEAAGDTAPALPVAERMTIALVALSTRERWLYLRHFSEQMVSLRVIARLVTSAERLRDAASAGGEAAYMPAAARALSLSPQLRRALWLYRWTKWSTPLERALEDRYEFLIVRRHVLREMQDFAGGTIARFFGNDVGARARELLEARETAVANAITAMSVRFGDYAEALAEHQLLRTALRLETAEYRSRLNESLITQEVFDAHQRRIEAQQAQADKRPNLEWNAQLVAMIRSVPMFAELPDKEIRWIASKLGPLLAAPGEKIVAAGDNDRSVYFVAAGKVEVHLPGRTIILESGAFFGEMALLQNRPRAADVVSVGYTQLLMLRGGAFRALLRRQKAMREAMEATAAARDAENKRLG